MINFSINWVLLLKTMIIVLKNNDHSKGVDSKAFQKFLAE